MIRHSLVRSIRLSITNSCYLIDLMVLDYEIFLYFVLLSLFCSSSNRFEVNGERREERDGVLFLLDILDGENASSGITGRTYRRELNGSREGSG